MVDGLFAVARKQRLRTRGGNPYLALELVDSSGRIDARVWNDVDLLDKRFREGDAVRVLGRVERFRDRLARHVERRHQLPVRRHLPARLLAAAEETTASRPRCLARRNPYPPMRISRQGRASSCARRPWLAWFRACQGSGSQVGGRRRERQRLDRRFSGTCRPSFRISAPMPASRSANSISRLARRAWTAAARTTLRVWPPFRSTRTAS